MDDFVMYIVENSRFSDVDRDIKSLSKFYKIHQGCKQNVQ